MMFDLDFKYKRNRKILLPPYHFKWCFKRKICFILSDVFKFSCKK